MQYLLFYDYHLPFHLVNEDDENNVTKMEGTIAVYSQF